MTVAKKSDTRSAKITFTRACFCFISVFMLAMIIKNSEIAIEYVRAGIKLCAGTVIPSLFPFMVISELLVTVGFAELFGGTLGKPLSRLFGISENGSCAFLLGCLCGFPIGAKTAVSLFDSGSITKEELQKLLVFCNLPSSAFLISAVGVSLYGCRDFGILILISAIASSVIAGVAARFLMHTESLYRPKYRPRRIINVASFTGAISSATLSMLLVCAYVIFFSAVVGCLSNLASKVLLPEASAPLLFGIFEMTSGISGASALDNKMLGALICAFNVGWSGLSVHFQIISLCTGRGISFVPYFISKLFQGILCAAIVGVYVKFISPEILENAKSVSLYDPKNIGEPRIRYALIICLAFLLCVVCLLKKLRIKE